ncbi:hypothetical protein A2U01_0110291, partial [Trifolium medium]|nr:hypothetical protein [Trifolium medium]
QPEPQGDPKPVAAEPVHVAEPYPDTVHVVEPHPDPAPAAEEDDDAVQEGEAGKKEEKLEGPSWTECIFPPA